MNKHLVSHLSWIVIFAMVLTACAGAAATPTATLPPPPTNTPVPPTATPEPTATATLVPTDTPEPTATATATPDKTATAQYVATQTAEAVVALVGKELEAVGLSTDTGHLLWAQNEPVGITLDSYNQALYDPFAQDPKASDFVLKSDVTWESTGGLAVCGFMFRSEKNFESGKQYQYRMLRLSGLPVWDISYWQNGNATKDISQVRSNAAINQKQESTNKIILIVEGEKFTLYINDVRVGDFYDYSKSMLDGYLAYLAYQESGQTTCTFSNTWIWALK